MVIKQYLGDFLSKPFNIKNTDSYFCLNYDKLPKGRIQGRIIMHEVSIDKQDKYGLEANYNFTVWFKPIDDPYKGNIYICSFPLSFFQEARDIEPVALLKTILDVDGNSIEVNLTDKFLEETKLKERSEYSWEHPENLKEGHALMLGTDTRGYITLIKSSSN